MYVPRHGLFELSCDQVESEMKLCSAGEYLIGTSRLDRVTCTWQRLLTAAEWIGDAVAHTVVQHGNHHVVFCRIYLNTCDR